MLAYIGRRALLAVFTVWAISVLSFAIIQLPPGDYVTSYIAQMASMGSVVSDEEAQSLRIQYGLGQPIYIQYLKWMKLVVVGNFGMSMEWRRPVTEVIGDRLLLTVVVAVASLILTWVLALPIGIFSAVRQYSAGDYVATFIGFIGLAVPNFLLALVLLYFGFILFNAHVGGLFSPDMQDAPWSLARAWDLAKHLPIPALILGLAGTAQQIRIMRANLLDELRKPYVVTARSKGLSELRVILKYPVRMALNPFASTIGYTLPYIVSGSIIVSLVLGLPTVGPLLLKALIAQDMFLAGTIVARSATEARIFVASQWQLMWWRFRKHKVAVISAVVVIGFYLVVATADFLAYADPNASEAQRSLMPPQRLYLFDGWRFAPYVHGFKGERDPATFKRVYRPDPSVKVPVRFFAPGFEYKFLGLIPTTRHLIGVDGDATRTIFLLGTDVQGRDLWSRLMYGTRISLTIGLFGVTLSLVLGVVLGGLSGFYGGAIDTIIQRTIEILRSIPTIPLWMGLAAAMPRDWTILQIYFAITIIISLLGWTELARVVRGRFLAMREEDFVISARLVGCSQMRTIFVHMVPSFMSHIIAATTLALPAMIISETALSFLGLGLRPPAISWGVLLQQAQNVQTVAISPWLMYPAVPVIIVVMAFNFLGDGLRDAADPYGR
ncbi:MAG: hypothetical protein DME16_01735 [Candidatus Rokuibacteriota bacterium]|nr:MAG: hypothetical protein DME16_01735 [Candidatus Rokubacteria bacterium]